MHANLRKMSTRKQNPYPTRFKLALNMSRTTTSKPLRSSKNLIRPRFLVVGRFSRKYSKISRLTNTTASWTGTPIAWRVTHSKQERSSIWSIMVSSKTLNSQSSPLPTIPAVNYCSTSYSPCPSNIPSISAKASSVASIPISPRANLAARPNEVIVVAKSLVYEPDGNFDYIKQISRWSSPKL